METKYLLSSTANKKRLEESIKQLGMTEKQRQKYSGYAIKKIVECEKELKKWQDISRRLNDINGDYKKADIELIDTLLEKVKDDPKSD